MDPLASTDSVTLYLDQSMAEPITHGFDGGWAAVFTRPGPGKEGPNEDAAGTFAFDERSGALAVADGMGGGRSGEKAAATALHALGEAIDEQRRAEDGLLRTAILNGMERANQAVIDLGLGAATTLSVVELHGRSIRTYHVGDSMALVTGQQGKLKLKTVGHGPVAMAEEAGFINPKQAMHHEDRHLVTNTIGSPEMRIEIGSTLTLAPRDTLLVGSDGLFDNLLLDEIVRTIRQGPLERSAGALARLAGERMTTPRGDQPSKPDDLTFIAFRLHPPRRRAKPDASHG